jgi:hypothetical protein
MSEKRNYEEEDCLLCGFTCIDERDGTQNTQPFFVRKNSCERSMTPAELKEHLTSVHPENASNDADFFRAKKAQFEKTGHSKN